MIRQGGTLRAQLDEAARRGFFGPRPVEEHVAHARGFAAAVARPPGDEERCCDLGSGGGLPGLVLAVAVWPASRWVLLDAMAKRCAFLREAVVALGLGERVEVVCGRVEELLRTDLSLRGAFSLVTARGFGAPPALAEAAAPLLAVGGRLVVSEPPGSRGERWDSPALATVGLALEWTGGASATYARLRQVSPCPDRFPRSAKAQRRQPLFHVEPA